MTTARTTVLRTRVSPTSEQPPQRSRSRSKSKSRSRSSCSHHGINNDHDTNGDTATAAVSAPDADAVASHIDIMRIRRRRFGSVRVAMLRKQLRPSTMTDKKWKSDDRLSFIPSGLLLLMPLLLLLSPSSLSSLPTTFSRTTTTATPTTTTATTTISSPLAAEAVVAVATSNSLFVHAYALVSPFPTRKRTPKTKISSLSLSISSSSRTDGTRRQSQSPALLRLSAVSSTATRSSTDGSPLRDDKSNNNNNINNKRFSRLKLRLRSSTSASSNTYSNKVNDKNDDGNSSNKNGNIGRISNSPSLSSSPTDAAKRLFTKFQRRQIKTSYRNLWIIPAIMILLTPAWVGRYSLHSINYLFQTLAWKSIARVSLVVWILISVFDNVFVTKRRQAKDMTSEWSRYATKPGARGRAIMWLLLQQAFFIVWASFYKDRSFKTSNGGLFGRIVTGRGRKQRQQQQQQSPVDTSTSTDATPVASGTTNNDGDGNIGRTHTPTPRQKKHEAIRKKAGRNFSNGLLKLGPLYIKLGQIVSCRPGLLGKEWIDAMADLQDRVPARTGQDALDLAYSSLEGGKEEFDQLFVDFDSTPLAAASLGQVHRARLRSNGDEIVIKVQRPYLRQIYNQDFVLLTTIAQWMDKLPSTSRNVGGIESSWTNIFVDAEDILYREIDYRDEADNAIRFANDFGLGKGGNATTPTAKALNNRTLPSAAEWIRTPYVYDKLSNERLLVMEFVPSIKVTNRAKLDAANVTEEDRIDLADSLARAYLRQFCAHLFFSTDPHPGNLGVEIVPETGKPRLVMYDFGQAASLTRGQGDGIEEIIEAIVDTDVDRSIEAFQKMGVLVDGADLDLVRAKVAENYRTGKIKANQKKLRRKGYVFRDDKLQGKMEKSSSSSISNAFSNTTTIDTATPTKTANNVNDAQVMSYFSLPAEYAFVARAISQMDGVGKSLDPEFDFISSAAPYLVEIKGADKYLVDEVMKFVKILSKFQMDTIPEWWERVTRDAADRDRLPPPRVRGTGAD